MTEELKPTPGLESTGENTAELWRRVVRGINQQVSEDRIENRRREELERLTGQYDTPDTLWFRCVRRNAKEGERERYTCTCITGLPDASMELVADVETLQDLVSEARFLFSMCLIRANVVKTGEEARARAAKAVIEIADVVR